jgi:hypothetical protein
MWWGWWMLSCEYAGKLYNVRPLQKDVHTGRNWYGELEVSVHIVLSGRDITMNEMFRHRDCGRISELFEAFSYLTCFACAQIL